MVDPVLEVVPSDAIPTALRAELRSLWAACFAGTFTAEDEAHAYGGLHAVVRRGPRVVAHGSVVPRELLVGWDPVQAGYVEAVATLPAERGRGTGSLVMSALGEVVQQGFAMGALSTSSPPFYERLGWERWRGPSYVVRGRSRRRTPDEDAGIMVLRTRLSAGLDLDLPIACQDRPGDAW